MFLSAVLFVIPAGELLSITFSSMFLSAVCDSSGRVVEHYLVCSFLLFCDTSNNVVLVGMRSLISKNYWLFSRLVF